MFHGFFFLPTYSVTTYFIPKQIVAEGYLTSGDKQIIDYGRQFLSSTSSPGDDLSNTEADDSLPYRESVRLVVEAARGYFNTSQHYRDDMLLMAK